MRGTMILIKHDPGALHFYSCSAVNETYIHTHAHTYTPRTHNRGKTHATYMYTLIIITTTINYSGYIRILKATNARASARRRKSDRETRENYFLEYCTQINTREKETE